MIVDVSVLAFVTLWGSFSALELLDSNCRALNLLVLVSWSGSNWIPLEASWDNSISSKWIATPWTILNVSLISQILIYFAFKRFPKRHIYSYKSGLGSRDERVSHTGFLFCPFAPREQPLSSAPRRSASTEAKRRPPPDWAIATTSWGQRSSRATCTCGV